MQLAGFVDVLGSTAGVIFGLCGIALTLLGLIAVGEGAFKTGSWATAAGVALVGIALWLVGAIG